MSGSLRDGLEAEALQQGTFDRLKRDVEVFDPLTGNIRDFYLLDVLTGLSGLTEGEARMLAPLIKDRLGIPQATLLKDLNERKRILEAIENKGEKKTDNKQEGFIKFNDPEPWPTPVTTKGLLDELAQTIRRYVILSDYEVISVALWLLHTWTFQTSMICPILGVESPQKRCGKSTLLGVLAELSCRSMLASNISPAAIFRTIEKYYPTLIIDEADTFLKDNEELRGVLNSGHTRSTAYVIRVDGDKFEPRIFSTWGPKVIALIGKLPDTLADRSIVVSMRRRRPDEKIEKRRLNDNNDLIEIKRKCKRWADEHICLFEIMEPKIPTGLHDRASDNWAPLFMIADMGGEDWGKKARSAALVLSGGESEAETVAVQLLGEFQDLFKKHSDRLPTSFIIEHLCKLEEKPWATWNRGKAISPRQVAKLLQPFGIASTTVRADSSEVSKGYKAESFVDVFSRYLPSGGNLSVTTLQANNDAMKRDFLSVTPENHVTDKKDGKSSIHAGCNVVTGKKGDIVPTQDNILFFDDEIEGGHS